VIAWQLNLDSRSRPLFFIRTDSQGSIAVAA
jgi:hypothetical protein